MLIKVMSQNIEYGAAADGRLPGLYRAVRDARPDVLLLQEANDLLDPDLRDEAATAMGMQIELAPSRNMPVAVAWNPSTLAKVGAETKYSRELHHGYCAVHFALPALPRPLPVPLVVISTHLTPYSADHAAQEAALISARVYRFGGLGLLGGDIKEHLFHLMQHMWLVLGRFYRGIAWRVSPSIG